MIRAQDVVSFWLNDVGPNGWYDVSEALDTKISQKFGPAWEEAAEGGYLAWLTNAEGALAYLILTDQFPRNMFRGQGKAFSTDTLGLAAAKQAISKDWDQKIDEPARQFFFLPLMHSENLCDQERCVRLMMERMPQTGAGNLLHARAHREVIRQFGRFPYRNDALERTTTAAEADYLAAGGYGHTLRALEKSQAA